jgi:HPt (histidine-containing phosphotransfer) domain-containing protein
MSEAQPAADGPNPHRSDAAGSPLFDTEQRGMLVDELGTASLVELEASFWNDCSELMTRAVVAWERRDRGELGDIVHTIKGAASNLGLAAIAAAASRLRAGLSSAGDWPELADLEAQVALTRQALADEAMKAG